MVQHIGLGTGSARPARRRPVSLAAAAVAVTAAFALASCTSGGAADTGSSSGPGADTSSSGAPSTSASESPTTQAPAPGAVITTALKKTTAVNPTTPVTVDVADGQLTSVTMTNPDGKKVAGALSDDGRSWHNTQVLGYSKTYKITAVATNGDGVRTAKKLSVTTLTPSNMTQPYFNTIYGSALQNNATYGVGFVPVVHFDEVIPDRAVAEKALKVTTSPHVDGVWYWADDGKTVHWRPKNFYKPGTKVTIAADVYGVNVGGGMYGQSDQKVSYTIGQRRIAIANAQTHHVKVYFDGKLVRDMPTSMGRGGVVEGDHGQNIYLWTMPGTYTVINHENPATMNSSSYGLSENSPYGYGDLTVPYATKISTDGIYLHELDSTVGVQGYQNVSHGCLNLNYDNAKWYFENSRLGDVVQVVKSGGPKLQFWQGGDWSVPWSEWVKGSALH